MIDGLPVNIGAGALVTLIVLMILTGRLVPRRTYDDALKKADAWEKVALEQAPLMARLLDSTRVTEGLLRSLADAVAHNQKGSG